MENLKNKKAIIYNRVSTIMQEKSESLSEQTDECIKFCKEKGYDIFKVFKDVKKILGVLENYDFSNTEWAKTINSFINLLKIARDNKSYINYY